MLVWILPASASRASGSPKIFCKDGNICFIHSAIAIEVASTIANNGIHADPKHGGVFAKVIG